MKAVTILSFTDERAEGQRGKETDLRSHSKLRINEKCVLNSRVLLSLPQHSTVITGFAEELDRRLQWLGIYLGSRVIIRDTWKWPFSTPHFYVCFSIGCFSLA